MKRLFLIVAAFVTMVSSCSFAENEPATPSDLACAHIHYQSLGTETDLYNAVYQDIPGDDTSHLVISRAKDIIFCLDCNQTIIVNEYDCQDLWPHTYENGVCTYCGHTSQCKHEQKYQVTDFYDYSSVQYIPKNSIEHTISGKGHTYYECETCGERQVIEDNLDLTYTDIHEFVNDVCIYCGYSNQCTHENMVYGYYGESWGHTYTPIDNTYHEVTFLARTYDYCVTCLEIFNENPAQLITEKEKHRVKNKRCIECGQEVECDHSGNVRIIDLDTTRKYINHGNQQTHTVVETGTFRRQCDDCHTNLGTAQRETEYEEKHIYRNSDKICEACGFENKCTHGNGTYKKYSALHGNRLVGHIDEKTHTYIGPILVESRCNLCNEVVDSYVDYDMTLTENHRYYDGVCAICEYRNTCQHTNTKTTCTIDGYDGISQINEYSHFLQGGIKCTKTTCVDCGVELKRNEEFNSETEESHIFENGKCSICGYVKPKEENEEYISLIPITEYSEHVSQTMNDLTDAITANNLAAILPDDVFQMLKEAGSLLANPSIVSMDEISGIPETITVLFTMDQELEEGRDIIILLGLVQETEVLWYAYPGKTQSNNTVSFSISRDNLELFGNNPIILTAFNVE